MIALLMTFFIILCFFIGLFVLIQPGKGDMGLGSIGGASQMLFGGSGGQNFFEKATWIMGIIFIFGALGLTILKTKHTEKSRLSGYIAPVQVEQKNMPAKMPVQPQPAKK